jgi:glycosyltransferase involved in cell wall biosynthesis
MITVIIPALNEENTINGVISLVKQSKLVSEVIVVDDKSLDKTVEISLKSGAKVITGTKLGKGASMRDGLLVAQNEIILFVDADITTYPQNLVELMTLPILNEGFDFVKSYFTRQAGRVTELVAKPLLSILYPEFPQFIQPLSGMIAGKKSFFNQINFEDGYGVDIGILIDMYKLNAKISEVDIGNIENRMQSLEQLGKMSKAVANTILDKSSKGGNKNLEVFENIQIIREQMEFAIREKSNQLSKIAIFDMDNTLLSKSFIHTCAEKFAKSISNCTSS